MNFTALDLLRSGELELVDVNMPTGRKVVYDKKEIQKMLDNNEDITNIILDSSLKDLSYLFGNREDFNQDLSNWDVSNVTNMRGMFYNAKSFNQDLSGWGVSSVGDMGLMFYKATSFNQDISNWDVSNVTDMRGIFEFATSFNQDLSRWDISSVKYKDYMFKDSGYTFPEPKGY
jgi:surface protein